MPEILQEPHIRFLKQTFRGNPLRPLRLDKDAERAAWELFHTMEAFKPPHQTDNSRQVWLKVNRGSIEDWMPYERYVEDWFEPKYLSSKPSQDLWERDWEWEFPEAAYWHLLEIRRQEDFLTIAIDNESFFGTTSEGPSSLENPYVACILRILNQAVEEVIWLSASGKYYKLLERDLPLRKRKGLIKRSDLWSINPTWYCLTDGVSAFELERRASALRSQAPREATPTIQNLTTGQYFSVLMDAYKAAGRTLEEYQIWRGNYPVSDGRAWYRYYGFDREVPIFAVDQDSPEAFREWFNDETVSKEEYNFEVYGGPDYYRCNLTPILKEDGWQFELCGSIPFHGKDLFALWETFNAKGLPTYFEQANALADAFLGEDYLLVAPEHEKTIYREGTYEGHDIVEAIHLPTGREKEVSELVRWFPIEVSELTEPR